MNTEVKRYMSDMGKKGGKAKTAKKISANEANLKKANRRRLLLSALKRAKDEGDLNERFFVIFGNEEDIIINELKSLDNDKYKTN